MNDQKQTPTSDLIKMLESLDSAELASTLGDLDARAAAEPTASEYGLISGAVVGAPKDDLTTVVAPLYNPNAHAEQTDACRAASGYNPALEGIPNDTPGLRGQLKNTTALTMLAEHFSAATTDTSALPKGAVTEPIDLIVDANAFRSPQIHPQGLGHRHRPIRVVITGPAHRGKSLLGLRLFKTLLDVGHTEVSFEDGETSALVRQQVIDSLGPLEPNTPITTQPIQIIEDHQIETRKAHLKQAIDSLSIPHDAKVAAQITAIFALIDAL